MKSKSIRSGSATFLLTVVMTSSCSSVYETIGSECIYTEEIDGNLNCNKKPHTGLVQYNQDSGYAYLLSFEEGIRSENKNAITLRPDGTVLNHAWTIDHDLKIDRRLAYDEHERLTADQLLIMTRNITVSTFYEYHENGTVRTVTNSVNFLNQGLETAYSEKGEISSQICWHNGTEIGIEFCLN